MIDAAQDSPLPTPVLVSGVMGQLAEGTCGLLEDAGFDPVFLGPITSQDIDCGLAHVDNDVCVASIAAVGQYLRALEGSGSAKPAVLAPELCHDCRSTCLPQLLNCAFERAGKHGVQVVEFNGADVAACCPAPRPPAAAGRRPVVGLCGNVPMLTTELFHKTVSERLVDKGFAVAMPPLAHLVHSADFLTPAMQYFHEHGIRSVVCICAFGCLGGHVFARGQVRKLQREYPDVELTILDYDPSASDINLANRVDLVMQSVLERMR